MTMSSGPVSLDGAELLAIQYLLDGKNSGYGYKFDVIIGINKANFSGPRNHEMLKTNLVQTAEETGELRKVKFYRVHKDTSEMKRAVQFNFYEDGHVRSSSEVPPEVYNNIVEVVSSAKRHSGMLESLSDLMDEYIHGIRLEAQKESHRSSVETNFNKLIDSLSYTGNNNMLEQYMYSTAIANIGISLLSDGSVTNRPGYNLNNLPDMWQSHIQEFFENYIQHSMSTVPKAKYVSCAKHLNQMLESWRSGYDRDEDPRGAIGLIDYYKNNYDI